MSSREDSVGHCQSAERRSYGRVPESLIAAFQPLLRQFNVTPLQLCLRCAMSDAHDRDLCDALGQAGGLEILPVAMGRDEIVGQLVRPLLTSMLNQVQASPGSIWVPDGQSLWRDLSASQRSQLVRYAVQQIKLRMTPVAQKRRCYPAGLSLQVTLPEAPGEAELSLIDSVSEATGWDCWPEPIDWNSLPQACRLGPKWEWQDLLGRSDYSRLNKLLRRYKIEPFRLSLLVAMADPNDWETRHEVTEVTGLEVTPFAAEREEVAAALREKLGSAEEDFWRQSALMPIYFQMDRLLPLLVEHEVLPLQLTLRLGTSEPRNLLAFHQIRLMTGFDVEPVEMTGQAVISTLQRMLREPNRPAPN